MRVSDEFVNVVRGVLIQQGIKQSQFAEMIGETRFWVSKLLNKKLKNISEDQVFRIKKALPIEWSPKPDDEVAKNPVALALADHITSRPDAQASFVVLMSLLGKDRLYTIPPLSADERLEIGELISSVSEQAKTEPVAAADEVLAKIAGVLEAKESKQNQPLPMTLKKGQ